MLENKVALVTGATGGLGREIAKKLQEAGCNVHISGRDEEKLEEIFYENPGFSSKNTADLRNIGVLSELIDEVKPDILINCAGIFPVSDICDTTEEVFDEAFDVNVKAPFFLTKYAIRHMRERDWGRIVNIGSSSAYSGFAGTSVYCSTKHALLGMSRSAFRECKESGIRIYCISPGSIKTEMGKSVRGQDFETFIEPSEIAEVIAHAISFDGEMISEEIRLNRLEVQ